MTILHVCLATDGSVPEEVCGVYSTDVAAEDACRALANDGFQAACQTWQLDAPPVSPPLLPPMQVNDQPREIPMSDAEVMPVPARGSSAVLPMADVIAEAIRQKLPAAELERLFALAERAADRQAKQDFNAALAAFQAVCPQVHKSKTVAFASNKGGAVRYTYAPLEVIAKTIGPALRAHGLSYTFTTALANNRMEVTCHVRHAGGHSESAMFPLPIMEGTGSMSESQKNGGTLTFGMRNALRMALGLTSTDDDTDAREPDSKASEAITDDEFHEVEAGIAEVRGNPQAILDRFHLATLNDLRRSDLPTVRAMIASKRAALKS